MVIETRWREIHLQEECVVVAARHRAGRDVTAQRAPHRGRCGRGACRGWPVCQHGAAASAPSLVRPQRPRTCTGPATRPEPHPASLVDGGLIFTTDSKTGDPDPGFIQMSIKPCFFHFLFIKRSLYPPPHALTKNKSPTPIEKNSECRRDGRMRYCALSTHSFLFFSPRNPNHTNQNIE